jgi:hypothetical protein
MFSSDRASSTRALCTLILIFRLISSVPAILMDLIFDKNSQLEKHTTMPILLSAVSERHGQHSKILPQVQRLQTGAQDQNAEYERLLLIVESRKDIGLKAAFADLCLEPRNPFDDDTKRKPRASVTLFGGLSLMALIVFLVSSLNAT